MQVYCYIFKYLCISDIWGAIESNRMGKCMSKVHKPTRKGCERPTCPSCLSSPVEAPVPNQSGIIYFCKVPGPTTVPFSQHQKKGRHDSLTSHFRNCDPRKGNDNSYICFVLFLKHGHADGHQQHTQESFRTLSTLPYFFHHAGHFKRELQKAASNIPCRILMSLLIGALKISTQSCQRWTAGGHDSSLY